jgi:predicted nucleic acid-binding protein
MGKIRSYLDAGVVIYAVDEVLRPETQRALAILADEEREFLVGDYVKLETLPKRVYHKQVKQVESIMDIFQDAEYIPSSPEIIAKAEELANAYGLAGMDALHVASAIVGGADELLTFEKSTKPFFRIPEDILKVKSLHEVVEPEEAGEGAEGSSRTSSGPSSGSTGPCGGASPPGRNRRPSSRR